MDYTKELVFLKNLKLPLKYNGSLYDNEDNLIMSMNREGGTTPLNPHQRDELLKFTCELLNKALIKP